MSALTEQAGAGFRGPDLSRQAFAEISAILRERAGIRLENGAQRLVISRLTKHLKRLDLETFEDFIRHIGTPQGASDLELMINALTTNTTRFFREQGHFQILEDDIMPRLIKKAKSGGRVRIWSAACSSGEEAYSIAAVVLKCFPDAGQYNFRILATDIDSQILETAKAAIYHASATRDVSTVYQTILFDPETPGGSVAVRKPVRDLVTVRYLNFMEPWPVSGPFDVIFCRNVAIYMDQPTQMRIWTGLESVLDREGILFIGHSERIGAPLSERLELFGPTSFRRPARHSSLT